MDSVCLCTAATGIVYRGLKGGSRKNVRLGCDQHAEVPVVDGLLCSHALPTGRVLLALVRLPTLVLSIAGGGRERVIKPRLYGASRTPARNLFRLGLATHVPVLIRCGHRRQLLGVVVSENRLAVGAAA